jgi:hypothetical protein
MRAADAQEGRESEHGEKPGTHGGDLFDVTSGVALITEMTGFDVPSKLLSQTFASEQRRRNA